MSPSARCSLLLLLLAASMTAGCVRRRMTIVTNVPDATIYVDDQEQGPSPVSLDFTYYGPRKIQAFKDRYKPVKLIEDIRPPWYQIPPIDFLAENLWPGEIRDERVVRIEMEPQTVQPFEEVRQRAEQLRGAAQAGYAAPLPPTSGSCRPGP